MNTLHFIFGEASLPYIKLDIIFSILNNFCNILYTVCVKLRYDHTV